MKELTSKTEVLRKDRSKLVETNKQLKTEIERIKPENNTGNGVSSLYSVINGLATKTNIRLLSLKPGKEINTDKSIEIPFELTVSDKYHKIGLFINQIENNGGLCKVDKVIISGHKTGEHTVDAAINLSFFKIK
ncbi:MAG: type 4a pilus biogenesis protein PilO [Fibrobacteres bacterium]|nr:type 4a pilus biogenesis protein PilO [Fibrobacterota bacterium]